MAIDQSNFAESKMNNKKIPALAAKSLIPDRSLVAQKEAAGQYFSSSEEGEIAVFQAYCECNFQLLSHPFLVKRLEDFMVELVNPTPNSITTWTVSVYLNEAYLGIPIDLEFFKYYYDMLKKSRSIIGSGSLLLHDGKEMEYIPMYTKSSWSVWKKKWFYMVIANNDPLHF